MRTVTAYPRVDSCYQVWPSASNPHPSTAQTQRRTRTVSDLLRKPNSQSDTIPTILSASQYILRGRRIYSSVQGLSAIPQWRLTRLSLSAPIRIPVYFRRSQYSGDPVLFEAEVSLRLLGFDPFPSTKLAVRSTPEIPFYSRPKSASNY